MALPLPVTPAPIEQPPARPIAVNINVGVPTGPSDNYTGGVVDGMLVIYTDLTDFAWWEPPR